MRPLRFTTGDHVPAWQVRAPRIRTTFVWVADITEHWTDEGKLYCCAIKDLFSNRVVGWSIDNRMKARLVVAALEMAVARRGGTVEGCILHSDRG